MSTKFYVGQSDYIAKLNEIDDLFNAAIAAPGTTAANVAAAVAARDAAKDFASAASTAVQVAASSAAQALNIYGTHTAVQTALTTAIASQIVSVDSAAVAQAAAARATATLQTTTYPINGVASFTTSHGYSYQPQVWITTPSGSSVETDVDYSAGAVTLTFAAPFTGTLHLK